MKIKSYIIALALCLFSLAGCEEPMPAGVTDIVLEPEQAELTEGDTLRINATLAPSDLKDKVISWTSSDESVAAVSASGLVEAIAEGNVRITASCDGVEAVCILTVRELVPVEKIIMNKTAVELARKDSVQLEVTVLPRDASPVGLLWSSSDENVATVSGDGLVHAVSVGECVIMASIGDITAECNVTVTGIALSGISLNHESLAMEKGTSERLEVIYEPSDTDDRTVTWSSGDSYVATVSEDGLVSAVAVGTAVITVTSEDGLTASCIVEVSGEAALGDYFYSDGTYSAELNPNKELVGIVFYTGNPVAEDKVLEAEHPGCTHGLAVSIEEYTSSWLDITGARDYPYVIGNWIEAHTDYPSTYTDTGDGKMETIMGYGLTKGLEAFNEASENSDWQIQFIVQLGWFKSGCPDVEGTSGWFMPSIRELDLLCHGESDGRPDWQPFLIRDLVNSKLESAGEERLDGFLYWSCLELDWENALLEGFTDYGYFFNGKSVGRSVRYVTAF